MSQDEVLTIKDVAVILETAENIVYSQADLRALEIRGQGRKHFDDRVERPARSNKGKAGSWET